jgi:hypothetical protein
MNTHQKLLTLVWIGKHLLFRLAIVGARFERFAAIRDRFAD